VRIERHVAPSTKTTGLIMKSDETSYDVVIQVGNYKRQKVTIEIVDQLPRSERDKVEVSCWARSPPRWAPRRRRLDPLAAGAAARRHADLKLSYRIIRPKGWELTSNDHAAAVLVLARRPRSTFGPPPPPHRIRIPHRVRRRLPDRARVTRVRTARCEDGAARAVFERLPGSLDARTLRGEVREAAEVIGIGSVEVNEREAADARVRGLAAEQERIETELKSKDARKTQIAAELEDVGAFGGLLSATLAEEIRNPKPNAPRVGRVAGRHARAPRRARGRTPQAGHRRPRAETGAGQGQARAAAARWRARDHAHHGDRDDRLPRTAARHRDGLLRVAGGGLAARVRLRRRAAHD
jgi:hypothetical protein